MFATNFNIKDEYLIHERGRENLTVYAQKETVATGKLMSNHFCKTCGTLLYRTAENYPGSSILRLGTVDDFTLMETKLKPQVEQFTKDRVSWLSGGAGVKQYEGSFYTPPGFAPRNTNGASL
jgi:hypothetical protein